MPDSAQRNDEAAGSAYRRESARRTLVAVVHDVAPATQAASERLIETIASVAPMPVTLLVVPRYHGQPSTPSFERWLDRRIELGDELALHGFTHLDEGLSRGWCDHIRRRWYTAGEGEFCALDSGEASRRIEAGRRWFAVHDWPLHGFVAPAWLMNSNIRKILAEQGFSYTATLSHLIELPSQRQLFSHSLVYSTRSTWRRLTSVAWNAMVYRANQNAPLLRLELHPTDARYPAITASWKRILSASIASRRPLTVRAAIALAPSAAWHVR